MKKKQYMYLATAGALVLLIAGMLFFTASMNKKNEGFANKPVDTTEAEGAIPFVKEVEKISGEVITSGIREMGELVTAEYYYSHAENYESLKKVLGITVPGTKLSFVYTVDGDILAGIDFTDVSVEVDEEAQLIRLSIPEAKIIASEIDHDSFSLLNEKSGWFTDLSAEDVNKTFAHVKEMEEAKAIEKGLLTRAGENAERILESFVKSSFQLDGYTVEVGE